MLGAVQFGAQLAVPPVTKHVPLAHGVLQLPQSVAVWMLRSQPSLATPLQSATLVLVHAKPQWPAVHVAVELGPLAQTVQLVPQ